MADNRLRQDKVILDVSLFSESVSLHESAFMYLNKLCDKIFFLNNTEDDLLLCKYASDIAVSTVRPAD